MGIGVTLFVLSVLVIAIWVFIEIKRLKHKLFAIFLILMLLFFYFTGAFVLKDQNIDLKSVPGIMTASKLYFSWLFSLGSNFQSMTTHAVSLNWDTKTNSTK